jgi:integrase
LESINERMLQDYYNYLAKQVEGGAMGDNHAAACMAEAKAFIRSRSDLRYIELPRNINSRSLTISVRPKAIETLTVAEVKHLLETPERLKLYVLLMLNCGMTSSDIGQLTKDEVDWKQGRLVRVRTKTRGKSEKVPTVDYRLWPETIRLLTQQKSDDPVLALTNAEGGPLWKMHRTESGTINRVDSIANLYTERTTAWREKLKTSGSFTSCGAETDHCIRESPRTCAVVASSTMPGPPLATPVAVSPLYWSTRSRKPVKASP